MPSVSQILCESRTWPEIKEPDERVWTRRERLSFPGIDVPAHYSLPLFVHNYEIDSRGFVLADGDGKPIRFCVDAIYEALDHQLFWLDILPDCQVYFYTNLEAGSDGTFQLGASQPECVLMLSEFFRDDITGVLSRWDLRAEMATAPSRMTTVQLLPKDMEGLPSCGGTGQALKLDTAAGFISLVRSLDFQADPESSRIHVRAHFYDDGENRSALGHWLGLKSPLGSACIGLAFGIDGCYCVLNGDIASGRSGEYHGWLRTGCDRSKGWHLFEIILEGGSANYIVDGEPLVTSKTEGPAAASEVYLVSRCGGTGTWAGTELFHTPCTNSLWDVGVQCAKPGDRLPWRIQIDNGRWQKDHQQVIHDVAFSSGAIARVTSDLQKLIDSFSRAPAGYSYKPGMQGMLGREYRILKISPDGMVGLPSPDKSDVGVWWFPPFANAIVMSQSVEISEEQPTEVVEDIPARSPTAPEVEVPEIKLIDCAPEEPAITQSSFMVSGLSIQCWSIPGEQDLARVERVMTTFVDALTASGIVLPDNINRLSSCQSDQHSSCFVYRFGTRRLHVSTRGGEGGRLLLVVRCGGGYMDFIEFARRHGSLERLRLKKQTEGGHEVVRITSVLSKGKMRAVTPSKPKSPRSRWS